MAQALIMRRGTKELAIRIICGTVQPVGAAGILWCNTGTQANTWRFSAATPSGPAAGDLWMHTDAVNTHTISLLKRNGVVVNLMRVMQWSGAAWGAIDAYYHNGTSWTQVSNTFNPVTDLSYTGTMQYIDDGNGHWRVKCLTGGTLTLANALNADVFLVGGGGGGATRHYSSAYRGGGGGAGGYTVTQRAVPLAQNVAYPITVGAGGAAGPGHEFSTGVTGGTSSAFGYSANGGLGGYGYQGRAGGSGGGAGLSPGHVGGTDGGNGGGTNGGAGQGTTTREFGAAGATLYAGGGGGGTEYQYDDGLSCAGGAGGGGNGGKWNTWATDGAVNTGGGGGGAGGGTYGGAGAGGSGMVIIRDVRP